VLRRDPPLNLARAVRRLQRERTSAAAPPEAAGSTSGRRRRLWELSPRALDMVLGVGLPHEALRRIARRVLRGEPRAVGHELHAGLVSECRRRGPMSEALQAELERRHAAALRGAAPLPGSDTLAAWWQARVARDELPGALWAALSHAHCTPALEARVLGEVQMLQFQAGQAARVELARFEALIDENAVLTRVLAEAQQRCSALMAEHARERQAHQAEMAALRGRIQALQEAAHAEALHKPGLSGREERLAAHEATAAAQRAAPQPTPRIAAAPIGEPVMKVRPAAAPEPAAADMAAPALDQRKVLCVGGRTASVPVYRRLVEACGGRFLHHDGGEQNKLGGLDATLAAADLVICQAGCVSHNAYWRVKDHCKRTGKRCVFVETPSAAGLQRALAQISD
jgi:Uncharacterized protein conserved in bacteria (DUF2325)